MFDQESICPYTGLRSFTEDESLYFKGREEDIDLATAQLQRNKFLMITGASGDGKSSLVYAGVIPNARAGFLRSTYSNWSVAGLRPEREPFQNLCRSLAKQLSIDNPQTVEGELGHGFSALIDLYKNSRLYVDTDSIAWNRADDKTKATMKREAANLIILVDQFEEFFTNPENYHRGAPSREANLVLNLLLETARIALEEDLPIYVVFTMRSDYIGQCAAFRGLPEYIGFSQFFVPRLNRAQLQLVIEEPAVLSGNRITRRLTERLIHDLTEGVDQLPILQHALSQIWLAADRGALEMDLLHYAMVGGMSVNELPEEQVPIFEHWFADLTPEIKACYHAPGLQNVLDTHTNKLYEQAAGYYTEKTGKSISATDAKLIIRTAFTCLTKIDQGRAVRNRMTLQEITHILSHPSFGTNEVGWVLNIFREPGNTFIHPFIQDEDPASRELGPDQVLDITHESLIRNWQYLGLWAKEEFDSHNISLDFEKQLARWVDSDRSADFLLSIGPLTYFETWYNNAKPNAWWIARYLPGDSSQEVKWQKASQMQSDSREFLKRSARNHVITRTFMRYGAKRVAAALGIFILVTLSSFTIVNYFKRQPAAILNNIHQRALQLASSPRVLTAPRATLLVEQLRMNKTTPEEIVQSIADPVQRLKVIGSVNALLVFQGFGDPLPLIMRCFTIEDSLIRHFVFPENDPAQIAGALKEINYLRQVLELAYHYKPIPEIDSLRFRNAVHGGEWVRLIAEKQPAKYIDMLNFDLALENAVNNKALSPDQISGLLKILSPFEGGGQTPWLQTNFNKDLLQVRGSVAQNYGFKHNGLYQELAYLYAAQGNAANALQCIDTLLENGQNNFQADYDNNLDNATNIAAVYYLNGNTKQLNEFVDGFALRKKTTAKDFYARLIARMIPGSEAIGGLELFDFMNQVMNLNLQFFDPAMIHFFGRQYRNAADKSKDPNQRLYDFAVSYKNEAMLTALSKETPDGSLIEKLFDTAFQYYYKVDRAYLQESVSSIFESAQEAQPMPRSLTFVFPDIQTTFNPKEPRSYSYNYTSDVFIDYVLRHQAFASLYPTQAELAYFPLWLMNYHIKNISIAAFLVDTCRQSVLQELDRKLDLNPASRNLDLNCLYLYLGKVEQQRNHLDSMLAYYARIDLTRLPNLFGAKAVVSFVADQSLAIVYETVKGYVKAGKFTQAVTLVQQFKNPVNRASLYSFVAGHLYKEKFDDKVVKQLIDSAAVETERIQSLNNGRMNRRLLAYDYSLLSPSANAVRAKELIRNIPNKTFALILISNAYAYHGDLYGALQQFPQYISLSDEADFFSNSLMGYEEGAGLNRGGDWTKFEGNYVYYLFWFMQYVDDNR